MKRGGAGGEGAERGGGEVPCKEGEEGGKEVSSERERAREGCGKRGRMGEWIQVRGGRGGWGEWRVRGVTWGHKRVCFELYSRYYSLRARVLSTAAVDGARTCAIPVGGGGRTTWRVCG